MQWQIGDVKITRVVELEIPGGTRFLLPQATPEAVLPYAEWLAPHFMTPEGKLIMSVHALVVETPTRKIIVDTCIGNDKERDIPTWNKLQLPFLEDLQKAGYAREDIDTVLCTHLHVDHVGWNTMLVDGKWIPTFPNARYLIAKSEYEYWDAEASEGINAGVMEDSVRPVFDAGLVDLIDVEHQVCEEVRLEPTPGHTPGHVSIHITSKGQEALITGDCFHHPCQMAHTDWASTADFDSAASTSTRESLLAQYSDQDLLVIGTHFATPTAGHIKSGKQGYWFRAFAD
ncbi:MAG: MBL fold metallo-hydrolase [Pseudomonadales bacterium]|nr:MBL fold metallo-hydrolase [Pseudomonadales bacterium]